MDELVSIIVPVHDCERFLGECIESIVAQSLTAWELVIVDDASRDGSPEVARRYAGMDDRIVCLRHEINLGPGCARNTGLDAVRGTHVMFVDADDWLPPDACAVLLEKCLESRSDIVFGQMH